MIRMIRMIRMRISLRIRTQIWLNRVETQNVSEEINIGPRHSQASRNTRMVGTWLLRTYGR